MAAADLLWRKNVGLLVYLARSPTRTRTREHLVGVFWADKPESVARHSLNEAVRVLRRCAGDGGVDTDAGQVRLTPDAVELDTERFEALAESGELGPAAALVAGEFLEGFSLPGASPFEDWLAVERGFWRRRCVEVLAQWADQLIGRGDVRQAGDVARRALLLDPWSDPAVRAMMRTCVLAGDRPGALVAFDAFAERLAAGVGTRPDAETVALAERVRRERAWRLPPRAQPEAADPPGAGPAPLVDRAEELGALLGVWATCRQTRRPALAVAEGEAGTGKTRLAAELVARARLDGAATAAIRAVEADLHDPWSGVRALARSGLLEAPGSAGAPARALATLRGAADGPLGPAFREVLAALCDEQPVLLLIDDVQWLDRDSLLAVLAAARDLAHGPFMALVTTTPHPPRAELDAARARVGRDLGGAVVRLRPLSTAGLQTLAQWALPHFADVDLARVTRRIAADSAGVPLLVVALLHAVAAGLDLDQGSTGVWPEPLRTLDQTLPGDLPDTIVAAIRIEFRRLSATAQRVLVAAALLGGRVATATLGQAARCEDEDLAAALDELEWEGWLTAEPRGYGFVARIVRDVLDRDMVTAGQRQRIRAMSTAAP